MKKINGLVKKLKICGIMLGCSILLSGCDADINDVFDHLSTDIQERVDENRKLLDRLNEVGLIGEEDYKTLCNSLEANTKKINNAIKDKPKDIPKALKSASVWSLPYNTGDPVYQLADDKMLNGDGTVSNDFKYPRIHTIVENSGAFLGIVAQHLDAAKSFDIFADKDAAYFKDIVGTHVYVLKSDDTGVDMANIASACNKLKNKTYADDAEKANCFSVLDKYFKDSGQTLIDDGDQIIRETLYNDRQGSETDQSNRYKMGLSGGGVEDQADFGSYGENGLGIDLALVSDGYASVTFRLNELNPEVIDKIISRSGDADTHGKYLVLRAKETGRTYNAIYLMEYPVSYVESIEYDKTNTKAKVNIQTSESIRVNIMSGEVVNIHGSSVLDATTKAAMEKLLNVNPSTSAGQSSFILWEQSENIVLSDGTYKDSSGTEVNKDNIEIGPTGHMTNGTNDVTEQGKKAETNTILLRDYLELNYMPGVVSEQERFVTLGRRLRINDLNTDGTIKDIEKPFANFVDKNGVVVEGGSVMITDLIDTSSGNKDNEKKSIKLAVYDDVGEKDIVGTTSDTGFTLDAIENTFEKVEYKDKISVTMQFPVEDSLNDNHIAIDDASYNFGSESRGIYYGMATDVNVFSSNLYSGWINISNAESGGIKWWNSWLENNKYSYRINEENLLAYLGLNFTAQMAKEGENYIVFNEETVKKLNEDIRQKERVDKATGVRTAFVLMGFLIIMYALVFISAWVVDTATANSIGMLKAITGGHCVAVQDDMDIPSVDASSTKYITFGSALIRGILIIAIGILLIKTDILGLAGSIFNAFKGIGTELFNRLFNI